MRRACRLATAFLALCRYAVPRSAPLHVVRVAVACGWHAESHAVLAIALLGSALDRGRYCAGILAVVRAVVRDHVVCKPLRPPALLAAGGRCASVTLALSGAARIVSAVVLVSRCERFAIPLVGLCVVLPLAGWSFRSTGCCNSRSGDGVCMLPLEC